jgi:hypothetical protein
MNHDLSNDWAVSQWLGAASPAHLELWRAENHWAALCAPVVLPELHPETEQKPDQGPQGG